MAGPLLAIAGRGEELVDELLVGFGIVVSGECGDLLGGGRKAGEIEVKAASERRAGGARSLGKFLLGEFCVEVLVDGIDGLGLGRDEAPPGGSLGLFAGFRVGCAGADPGFEDGDLLGLKRVGRGHRSEALFVFDGFEEV